MRKICAIPAFLISFLLLLHCNAFAAAAAKFITGEELQAMMKDGKQLAIIDIRELDYYGRASIPGSINVPAETAVHRRPLVYEYGPQDRIVIVGYGGTSGQEIVDMFLAHGFQNVYWLKGGMKEWKGPVATK